MNIWMVHPRLDRRGGAENLIRSLCHGLALRGHQLSVATLRFDPAAWPAAAWEGVEVRTLTAPLDRVVRRGLRARLRARRLARQVAQADAVVAHNFPAALWVAGCTAGPSPLRVWYCHEPSERLHGRAVFPNLYAAGEAGADAYPWADGAFVRQKERLESRRPAATRSDRRLDLEAVTRLDLVLANSAFCAAAVEAIYAVAAHPCLPGVEAQVARANEPSPRPYVAWVTNPRVAKNAAGFVEAVGLARAEAADLTVRAVGLDAAWRDRIALRGLADSVETLDPLDDAAYARLLAGARFVAYPTIDEPFGLVPIDAMAQGRAVLASSCGGPAESVEAGVTGVLADPLDPPALARELVALWRDPARCEALGRAGRDRYEREFTLDRFLDRFEAALREKLPGRTGQAARG